MQVTSDILAGTIEFLLVLADLTVAVWISTNCGLSLYSNHCLRSKIPCVR